MLLTKTLSKAFIGLCLVTITTLVYAVDHDMKSYEDPTKGITLTKKELTFTIKLASNPTTGYSWLLKKWDSKMIAAVKHTYQAPDTNRIGAGGHELWTFKINPNAFTVPIVTNITLIYARPWSLKENNKEVTFSVVTAAE
ncbi:protease inhibitor I42 family protein [soil metagenome]